MLQDFLNKKPKVSVILPNYNCATYLDQRIQSILSQTYTDFELIILDDASDDNSLEIIGKYTNNSRIFTQFYTLNSGLPFKRWKDGANLARGDYLWFAEADDFCEPTMLEKLIKVLENNPKIGIAFCESWVIDSHGNKLCLASSFLNNFKEDRWERSFIDSGQIECYKYLVWQNTIPNASAVVMRRQCFLEHPDFNQDLVLAGDWLLWVKILQKVDLAFIAEPLNYFRRHPCSASKIRGVKGQLLEESYRVRAYIVKNILISDSLIQTLGHQMIIDWLRTTIYEFRDIPLSRHKILYKIAKELNFQIQLNLILNFIKQTISKKLGKS